MSRAAVAAMLALLGLAAACHNGWAAERVMLDRAKIIVNDRMVTLREVQTTRQLQERDYRARFKGEELERKLAELDSEITEQIIQTLLLEARAEELDIQVSDKEIEERVTTIMQRDPRIAGAYSDKALKEFVVKDLLKKRVVQREVNSRVVVDEKALHAECLAEAREGREVDVGHILVRGDAAQAEQRLAEVRAKLDAGVPFEELAAEYSEDPAAKQNKGRLGFISRGQFVAPFEKAAFALEVGEVSKPVHTRFGYHIIKVFGERAKEKINCDKMGEALRTRLHAKVWSRQRNAELKKYLEELRTKAEVVVLK